MDNNNVNNSANKNIAKKRLRDFAQETETEFANDQLGENASGIDNENDQYKNEHASKRKK
jgi:hypothetical protein